MNKTILISMLTILLIVATIQALPQGAITINSPSDNTWTNLVNYSSNFNFSVNDNEGNYSVNCSLYIGTTQNLPLIIATANSSYASQIMYQETNTVFSMNHDLPENDTTYYWAIKCYNNTHLPSVASDLRTLKQSVTTPTLSINDVSFTNNTYVTLPMRFEVTAIDNSTQGEALTLTIRNGTGYSHESASVYNETLTNITWSPADGTYVVDLNVSNPAGNTAINDTTYTVYVDATTPVVSWNSPASGIATASTYQELNFSLTEQNVDTIQLNWSGTTETVAIGNCTGTAPNYECEFNKTGVTSTRNVAYGLIINDSAGNELETALRNISINSSTPTIIAYNWTVTSSIAAWRFLITGTTPETCLAKLYDKNGSYVSTSTGTLGTIGATTNCTGTFIESDINKDGAITAEFSVTDEVNNTVLENHTGVVNELYAGWNIITYADSTRAVNTICGEIGSCTSVAWYNNSKQAYTTFSTSTPGTNNATSISPGDAILVYVSVDSAYIANNNLPGATDDGRYITLYDGGWNTMGLILNANLSSVYYAPANNTGLYNISYASLYNANTETFSTCKRSSGLCAGTSTAATNIDLPLGYAVWVLTDQGLNYTINRTEVLGRNQQQKLFYFF